MATSPRTAHHLALGRLIRLRREALGLSQEDLGHAADVDRSHVGALERGEGNPAFGTLLALADALEVRLPDLLAAVETLSAGLPE